MINISFRVNLYNILKNKILSYKKTYVSLDDLYDFIENTNKSLMVEVACPEGDKDFTEIISALVEEHLIEPVKTSHNTIKGMRTKYKILKNDYKEIENEILNLETPIITRYYLNHPEEYIKDKEYIVIINEFIKKAKKTPQDSVTVNERSYELFNDEKFLKDSSRDKSKGERILGYLGLDWINLACYKTYEPFFYFAVDNYLEKKERTVLIIENKDTFWSFKRLIFETGSILDINFLIYGEGNKITSSFQFVEDKKLTKEDKYIYFGDMDPEGINIFASLKDRYYDYNIEPFISSYNYLIDLTENRKLQKLKKDQKVRGSNLEIFSQYFSSPYKEKIIDLIQREVYIPQEALSFTCLKKYYSFTA